MGVQVILDYAVHHPEQVRALIPICGSYGRPLTTFHDSAIGDHLFPYLNRAVARFPNVAKALWQFAAGSPLAYPIATTFEVNGDFLSREDFQPYFDHLGKMDVGVFFRMLAELNAHDLEDKIAAITQPTLIVAGERDTFTPAWLSLKMQQKIAGSELLFVPGGSHTAPIEFPELLNLRVEKFFRERLSLRVAA
jgi:pimeloyl-ACP methyl ester carboxylesterase